MGFGEPEFYYQSSDPCPDLEREIGLRKQQYAHGGITLDHDWILFTKFKEKTWTGQ